MQTDPAHPIFVRRSIVLTPDDLSLQSWPSLAKHAGLNVIALHPFPEPVLAFVQSDAGQRFLREVEALGLDVEYELHAMRYLLPRELFAEQPHLFRMNESGERVADCNLCPSSEESLEIAGRRAIQLSQSLCPTTRRHFLWPDDAAPWCHCPNCGDLTPSDQSLIVANHILRALRGEDREATVAALCYANTLEPPESVRPRDGVFMEFAPIEQDLSRAINDPHCEANRRLAERFEALLKVFSAETAQVLGYWLDCSRFSGWRRPAVRIPYEDAVLRADLEYYTAHGIRSVTSFGVWLDADYVARFGMPPIAAYGKALSQ